MFIIREIVDFIEDHISILISFSIIFFIVFLLIEYDKPIKVQENSTIEYNSNFNLIEKINGNEYIVYDKKTNVIYYIYKNCYEYEMYPLYNSDGTIQIYDKGE